MGLGLGQGQGGEELAGVWASCGGHQGGARHGERAGELCVYRTECDLGPRARPRPAPTPAWAPPRREPGGTDIGDGLVFSRLVFKVKCLQ